MLLDKAGTSSARYGYQPYGDLDSDLSAGDESANTPINPYRYTGKRYDSGGKALDMGARRFSPDTGRFLQVDQCSGAHRLPYPPADVHTYERTLIGSAAPRPGAGR